jgi:hypothetical protein
VHVEVSLPLLLRLFVALLDPETLGLRVATAVCVIEVDTVGLYERVPVVLTVFFGNTEDEHDKQELEVGVSVGTRVTLGVIDGLDEREVDMDGEIVCDGDIEPESVREGDKVELEVIELLLVLLAEVVNVPDVVIVALGEAHMKLTACG